MRIPHPQIIGKLVDYRKLSWSLPNTPIKGWKKPTNIREYEIDWSNPLTRGLTHYMPSVGGAIVNLTNGERWRTNDTGTVELNRATQYGTGSARSTATDHHADAPIYNTGYRPIDTSDGVGTGAFTMLSFASPISAGVRGILFTQRTSVSHCSLMANTNTAGNASTGVFAFQTYNSTYSGCAHAGVCDGEFHIFVGCRRENDAVELHVDGEHVKTETPANKDIYNGNSSSEYMYIGGHNAGSSLAVTTPILLSAAWGRDLTNAEIESISRDPWQILKPVVNTTPIIVVQAVTPPEALTRYWLRDRTLLEPYLAVPKRQPIGQVQVDWTHPMARGLRLVMIPKAGYVNLVDGEQPKTIRTGNLVEHAKDGAYFYSVSDDRQVIYADSDKYEGGSLSIATGVTPRSLSTTRVYMSKFADGDNNDSWNIHANAAQLRFELKTSAVWATATAGNLTQDGYSVLAGTYDGANITAYLNGIAGSPTAKTGTTSSTSDVHIGGSGSSLTTQYSIADHHFAYVWNRALSAAEVASLSRDPYQFLQPVAPALPIVVQAVTPEALTTRYPLPYIRPNRTQPTRRLRLKADHPLRRKLIGFIALNAANQYKDLCGNFTLNSNPLSTLEHNQLKQLASTVHKTTWAYSGKGWTGSYAIAWGIDIESLDAGNFMGHVIMDNGAASFSFITAAGDDGTGYFSVDNITRLTPASAYTGGVRNQNFLYTMDDAANTQAVFKNGQKLDSLGNVGSPAQPTTLQLGESGKNNSQWFSYVAVFNANVDDGTARRLTLDIWDLVEEVEFAEVNMPIVVTATTPGEGDGGSGTPGTHVFYEKFLERIGDGQIALSTVVLKCALISDLISVPPGGGATASDPRWGAGGDQDLSTNEVSGGNYTTGGVAVDGTDPWAHATPQAVYTAQTASWASGGATPPDNIRWAVIYDDTSKYAVSYILMYDGDIPLTLDTQGIEVRWNAGVTSGTAFHATQA